MRASQFWQAEKKALADELDLAMRRLAEAETVKRVEAARPGTPAKRLAQLQSQLDTARYELTLTSSTPVCNPSLMSM